MRKTLYRQLHTWLHLAIVFFGSIGSVAHAHSARLADTSWRGTDIFGTRVDWYFAPDGTLIARDPRGVMVGSASWKQTDELVEIEFNNGFVSLKGAVASEQLSGTGVSRTGKTGPWSLTREAHNFESLVQLHTSRNSPPRTLWPNAAALNGRYAGQVTERNTTSEITLECGSEQSCRLLLPRGPRSAARPQEPVTPRRIAPARMAAYQNAINFVRNNRFETANRNHPLYQSLSPVLEGDTTLDSCHELWQPGPPPEVICATRANTAQRPVWLYFAPLMSCGGSFCAYLPIALYPAKP